MTGLRFSCSNCGQHIEAPAEAAGLPVNCPVCQQELHVPNLPAAAAPAQIPDTSSGVLCAICQCTIQSNEPTTHCPACSSQYHPDCWTENGGCGAYGCSQAPEVEPRRAIEIPMSYWGQDYKHCPACGQQILAAAIRCRQCGAAFASARPEDATEFEQHAKLKARLPQLKRGVVCLFVISVIPCVAPIGAIWGAIWYSINRKDLAALPAVFAALCKIGLAVSIGQSLLMGLMAAFYAATRVP